MLNQPTWQQYLYISGAIVSFIGAFVAMGDSLFFTRPLIDRLPPWNHINTGISILSKFDDEIELEGKRIVAMLGSGEQGLKEILDVIEEHRVLPKNRMQKIYNVRLGQLQLDDNVIDIERVICLGYPKGIYYPVAKEVTLWEWIESCRFRRILFWVFYL